MAAIARIDLGMSSREFWEMTPRQFHFLVKRHEKRIKREWQHTSSMMALYANCHRDSKSRPTPFNPEDFMPMKDASAIKPKQKGLGPEVFEAFKRAYHG